MCGTESPHRFFLNCLQYAALGASAQWPIALRWP